MYPGLAGWAGTSPVNFAFRLYICGLLRCSPLEYVLSYLEIVIVAMSFCCPSHVIACRRRMLRTVKSGRIKGYIRLCITLYTLSSCPNLLYSGLPSQTSSNSPFSSISLKISSPPSNSPFKIICGNADRQSHIPPMIPHNDQRLTRPVVDFLQTLSDLLVAEDIKPGKLDSLFPQ